MALDDFIVDGGVDAQEASYLSTKVYSPTFLTGLEAAAVVTEAPGADDAGRAAVADLTPDAPVIVARPDGTPRS